MSTEQVTENILKNTMKKVGVGGAIGAGLDAYQFFSTYNEKKQEGRSGAYSFISGLSSAYLTNIIGAKTFIGLSAVQNVPKLAVGGYETLSKQARSMSMGLNQPFATSTFVDNPQIYTMRQAGMALAERSKYNLQQTIMGNEARYFHR